VIAKHKRVNFVCVMDAVNGGDGAWEWPERYKTCFVHVKSGGQKVVFDPTWKSGGQLTLLTPCFCGLWAQM